VEKVIEEIREVDGVLDVRVERLASKVVVVVKPAVGFNDRDSLFRNVELKAIRNREASFVELDAEEKPKNEGPQVYRAQGHSSPTPSTLPDSQTATAAPGRQNPWTPPHSPERDGKSNYRDLLQKRQSQSCSIL
jgi:hypothetical protein